MMPSVSVPIKQSILKQMKKEIRIAKKKYSTMKKTYRKWSRNTPISLTQKVKAPVCSTNDVQIAAHITQQLQS